MEKYFKIRNTWDNIVQRVREASGVFEVEEKIDGSQIRGGISINGEIMVGSKSVDFDDMHPPAKEFIIGYQSMVKALEKLNDGVNTYMLFGEYLEKPRHNTIIYDRVPRNNIYLFDAKINGMWVDHDKLIEIANLVEFEPVNLVTTFDHFPSMDEIDPYVKAGSVLGGQREGVVIKNRSIQYISYTIPQFFAIRVVDKKFKELNDTIWKSERRAGVRSIDDLLDAIMEDFKLPAVWNKAAQHLRDAGQSEHSMRDIPKLINLVNEDIEKEYKGVIEEIMYKELYRRIAKRFTAGMPEYYKGYLVDELAEVGKQ